MKSFKCEDGWWTSSFRMDVDTGECLVGVAVPIKHSTYSDLDGTTMVIKEGRYIN